MKILLLALALLPSLALADDPGSDLNFQERIDEFTQPMFTAPAYDGPTYNCIARDAKGRNFQGFWTSYDLNRAKVRAMRSCGRWGNKGCRLVRCAKN